MNQEDVVEYLENWLAIEKAKLQPDPPTKAPKKDEECLVLWADGDTRPTTFAPSSSAHQAYLASGHLTWGPDMERDAKWKQEQFRRVPQGPPPFKKGQTAYALWEDGDVSDGWVWSGLPVDHAYYRAGCLFGSEEERDEEAKRRGL